MQTYHIYMMINAKMITEVKIDILTKCVMSFLLLFFFTNSVSCIKQPIPHMLVLYKNKCVSGAEHVFSVQHCMTFNVEHVIQYKTKNPCNVCPCEKIW